MNLNAIHEKFGDDYIADERTFTMGIDQRFTKHFSERFCRQRVLETCTGGGFTTVSLARLAKHVITVEINQNHRRQAEENVAKAGLLNQVTFISGSIMDEALLEKLPAVDAAFLDPDWAVTGPDHVYRFRNSNTNPPADLLLERILKLTQNVAIILPPFIDTKELEGLPRHECQNFYLGESHELICLYFGEFCSSSGETEFRLKAYKED